MSESAITVDSGFVPYKMWRLRPAAATTTGLERLFYLEPTGHSAPIHWASMEMGELSGRPNSLPWI